MISLDEKGLLSVDAFTKAYKKLADKGKIVISMNKLLEVLRNYMAVNKIFWETLKI